VHSSLYISLLIFFKKYNIIYIGSDKYEEIF
jgi:hypothetical protein